MKHLYPFMPEAKKTAPKEVNVDARILRQAVDYLKGEVSESLLANPAEHLLIWGLSKALLGCTSQAVKTQLAHAKARQYVNHLNLQEETADAARVFLPSLHAEGSNYTLSLSDYLQFGKALVHQSVQNGAVRIETHELNQLLEQAIAQKMLDVPPVQEVPEDIRTAAAQLEPPQPARAYNRKFLNLGCLQFIQQGVGEGKRFYGAMTLCIAAQKDGLTKEAAHALLEQYVNRNAGTAPFTLAEAESTLNWVWGKSIGFSCKHTMDNGFEGPYCQSCPLNWKRKKF